MMRISQIVTLIIGGLAILIASSFEKVLEAILFAYSFMVSGLFVPTLGAYFWKNATPAGAFWGMLLGGTVTLMLQLRVFSLPDTLSSLKLDPSAFGIALSAIAFFAISFLTRNKRNIQTKEFATHV